MILAKAQRLWRLAGNLIASKHGKNIERRENAMEFERTL